MVSNCMPTSLPEFHDKSQSITEDVERLGLHALSVASDVRHNKAVAHHSRINAFAFEQTPVVSGFASKYHASKSNNLRVSTLKGFNSSSDESSGRVVVTNSEAKAMELLYPSPRRVSPLIRQDDLPTSVTQSQYGISVVQTEGELAADVWADMVHDLLLWMEDLANSIQGKHLDSHDHPCIMDSDSSRDKHRKIAGTCYILRKAALDTVRVLEIGEYAQNLKCMIDEQFHDLRYEIASRSKCRSEKFEKRVTTMRESCAQDTSVEGENTVPSDQDLLPLMRNLKINTELLHSELELAGDNPQAAMQHAIIACDLAETEPEDRNLRSRCYYWRGAAALGSKQFADSAHFLRKALACEASSTETGWVDDVLNRAELGLRELHLPQAIENEPLSKAPRKPNEFCDRSISPRTIDKGSAASPVSLAARRQLRLPALNSLKFFNNRYAEHQHRVSTWKSTPLDVASLQADPKTAYLLPTMHAKANGMRQSDAVIDIEPQSLNNHTNPDVFTQPISHHTRRQNNLSTIQHLPISLPLPTPMHQPTSLHLPIDNPGPRSIRHLRKRSRIADEEALQSQANAASTVIATPQKTTTLHVKRLSADFVNDEEMQSPKPIISIWKRLSMLG